MQEPPITRPTSDNAAHHEDALPEIPADIAAALDEQSITLTPFSQRNDILLDPRLQGEAGYRFFDDGVTLVSMYCPMPGVTREMVDWWFWWHPQANARYQAWYPGAHKSIGYARCDAGYFAAPEQPPFRDNDQYPVETIGGRTANLVIHFRSPKEMGFSPEAMRRAGVGTVVCGRVDLRHLFTHTEMAHVFLREEDGLMLVSRFWMGQDIRCKSLRRAVITDELARGMAEHCCVEYRNLARILPWIYREFH
ncbi:DAPG hydrolase family protein [Olsenella sp. Marseille-P4559]|uniref:DAPG hydrolase family protein n=1 Tax=Olsenella sp. Marseille-P4559 TaxID=2364795 RepID=UPI00102F4E48|nr:hypothetical protein [Olsenella sp. Marseille-P4559]